MLRRGLCTRPTFSACFPPPEQDIRRDDYLDVLALGHSEDVRVRKTFPKTKTATSEVTYTSSAEQAKGTRTLTLTGQINIAHFIQQHLSWLKTDVTRHDNQCMLLLRMNKYAELV